MNILQSKDFEALRLHGWVALRRSNAIKVEDLVVRLARQLDAPTPSRKGRGAIVQDWRTLAKCNYATNGIFCFRSN